MAGYGSGIGLGLQGGFGVGGGGGSATSLRTANSGQLYASKTGRMNGMAVHHWLWVLVLLELGALVALRVIVFRPYHAG